MNLSHKEMEFEIFWRKYSYLTQEHAQEMFKEITKSQARINKLEEALIDLIGVIEAHECTCFSCDRDGEKYCDCLLRQSKNSKQALQETGENK